MKQFMLALLIFLLYVVGYAVGVRDTHEDLDSTGSVGTEVTTESVEVPYTYILNDTKPENELPYFNGKLCPPCNSSVKFSFENNNELYTLSIDNSSKDFYFDAFESMQGSTYPDETHFYVLDTEGDLIRINLSISRSTTVEHIEEYYGSGYKRLPESSDWIVYVGDGNDLLLNYQLGLLDMLVRVPYCNNISNNSMIDFCEKLMDKISLKNMEAIGEPVELDANTTNIEISENIKFRIPQTHYIDYWIYYGIETDRVNRNYLLLSTNSKDEVFSYEICEYVSGKSIDSLTDDDFDLVPITVGKTTLYKAFVKDSTNMVGIYFECDNTLYSVRVVSNFNYSGDFSLNEDLVLSAILNNVLRVN